MAMHEVGITVGPQNQGSSLRLHMLCPAIGQHPICAIQKGLSQQTFTFIWWINYWLYFLGHLCLTSGQATFSVSILSQGIYMLAPTNCTGWMWTNHAICHCIWPLLLMAMWKTVDFSKNPTWSLVDSDICFRNMVIRWVSNERAAF